MSLRIPTGGTIGVGGGGGNGRGREGDPPPKTSWKTSAAARAAPESDLWPRDPGPKMVNPRELPREPMPPKVNDDRPPL